MENQDKIEEKAINLLDLLHVLVKRKKLIVSVCAIAILVSVIYSLTLPNIYSATAKVLPPQKESGGSFSALLGQAGGLAGLAGAAGLTGGSDLYLGILKSRSVEDAVIQRLDLVKVYKKNSLEDARRALEGALKFQAGKDGIITITAEDRDPKRSAQLANTVVDELGRTTVRLNLSKAGTERVFLEKRLEVVKKDLKAAEDDLKAFSFQNRVVQVDSQAKAAIEGIARLKAELASKEVQLSVLRNNRTEQSPEVKSIEAGITRLRDEISRLAGSGGGAEGIPSVGNVPSVGLEYARKMRELKTQEAVFEQLTKQYEMAKLSEAKDSSSLQVLDDAVVPLQKSKPRRSQIVIIATVTGFFISVFAAFILEYIQKMSDEDKEIFNSIKRQVLSLN